MFTSVDCFNEERDQKLALACTSCRSWTPSLSSSPSRPAESSFAARPAAIEMEEAKKGKGVRCRGESPHTRASLCASCGGASARLHPAAPSEADAARGHAAGAPAGVHPGQGDPRLELSARPGHAEQSDARAAARGGRPECQARHDAQLADDHGAVAEEAAGEGQRMAPDRTAQGAQQAARP
eukprot:4738425-Prymnesium_polylepis.1